MEIERNPAGTLDKESSAGSKYPWERVMSDLRDCLFRLSDDPFLRGGLLHNEFAGDGAGRSGDVDQIDAVGER